MHRGGRLSGSPRPVPVDNTDKEIYKQYRRNFTYTYNLNTSSQTVGLNAGGKIFGVNYQAEVASNYKQFKYPGAVANHYSLTNLFRATDNWQGEWRTAGFLKANREFLNKKFFNL